MSHDEQMQCALCAYCIWNDICPKGKECKHFSSIINDLDDGRVEKYIETSRRNFHHEWFQYITEYE